MVFRLADEGEPPSSIARRLGLADSTPRRLLARRRRLGPAALAPGYQACGQHQRAEQPWHADALRLRALRPRWGAGRVLVELRRRPGQPVPSARALQRFLARSGVGPAPRGRPPAEQASRSRVPHEVWQVDAVEQERLATGQQVSWLRVADEASGAVLLTVVFPPGALQLRARREGAGGPARRLRPVGTAGGRQGG